MAIFRLKEQSALNDDDNVKGAASAMNNKAVVISGGSENTPAAEIAQTMTGGAPKQVAPAAVGGAGVITGQAQPAEAQPVETQSNENTQKVIREVVVRGPASHAMTEVLNIFLGKHNGGEAMANLRAETMRMESAILQSVTIQQIQDEEDDEEHKSKAKEYVYVFDGRKMSLQDVDALEQIMENPTTNDGYVAAVVVDRGDEFVMRHQSPEALNALEIRAESAKIPFFLTIGACGRHFGV